MRRARIVRVGLIVCAVLVILGGAFLWALPEIIRRVALDQVPKTTGRAVAIEDVDLNVFTGRMAIKKLRIAEREGSEAFVELERVDIRLSPRALMRSELRLREVVVVAPSVRVVRTGPAEFNFSDLTQPTATPTPEPAAPSSWVVTVERLDVSRGSVRFEDRAVTPATSWAVQDLGVEAADVTTRAGAAPGRLAVRAKIDDAALEVKADPLRLAPHALAATITLDNFEMRRLNPYVFAATPYQAAAGRVSLAIDAHIDADANDDLRKAAVAAKVSIAGEGFTRSGGTEPLLGLSRVTVRVKEADLVARTLTVASLAVEGLDLKARRDAKGVIDLIDIFMPKPGAPGSAPAPTAASPPAPPVERKLFPVLRALARGFHEITIENITLAPSTATFIDESVTPKTPLALTKLQASIDDLTWPPRRPAKLALSTGLPGGGTLEIKGPVVPEPLDADLAFTLRDAPVTPYQAYIPVPAQLSGRFSGDSRNRIALKNGAWTLASRGNSWAQDVAIREPGKDAPVMRVERMELTGVDFDWPKRAGVAKVVIRKPAMQVERAADGTINVRTLFTTPDQDGGAKAKPEPPPAPKAADPAPRQEKDLLQTLALDFKEVRVEQGEIRFLDRTTTPAFSQDLSRLDMTVTGMNNRPGERAKLALKSVVGGDASLDVRGEIGSIGSPPFIELVGELRSFQLASVDPYAEAAIGWMIKKGELQYKWRFKLDGDALAVDNDVVVGKLQVAPASGGDEVKQRIGLPLNLIVSLIKDGNGDIRANVPVTGSINDPKFDLRETIWAAVKNVLANVVKAPFRMISRLFSGGDDKVEEPKVDPVVFAAGSSVIGPDMEEHLLRVADFLRRAPFVNLSLATTSSGADTEALKREAVALRLREFQKGRGLKDGNAALAAYFKERLPEVKPPATPEEQLALLIEQEPVPEGLLAGLSQRRLDATRERLTTVEGIPAGRLTAEEPQPGAAAPRDDAAPKADAAAPKADEAGRVVFSVVAGAE